MVKSISMLTDEELMALTDEELECMSKAEPKSNSRKMLCVTFLLKLIMQYGSKKQPITQRRLGYLLDRLYGIKMERKSISRNVHLLAEEPSFFIRVTEGGVYYDADAAEADNMSRGPWGKFAA